MIVNSDALTHLMMMDDNSVHCAITSPPYYGLRQYLFDGAVVIKRDLTKEQIIYLLIELNKNDVKPKYGGA